MIPIFIGYDPREAIAFHTCSNSIIRHATQPVQIIPLALNLFKDYKETHTDGSNQFIYSRFLVPHLMQFNGWAIFIDGDMVVRDDITKLWDLQNPYKDVLVVKHDYKTKMSENYLGSKNEDYPKKNWSSVMLWNCSHWLNKRLTPQFIQEQTGKYLHRFEWLKYPEEQVGKLDETWNWLETEYEYNKDAKLVHHTLGTPCFKDYQNTDYSQEWWDCYKRMIYPLKGNGQESEL